MLVIEKEQHFCCIFLRILCKKAPLAHKSSQWVESKAVRGIFVKVEGVGGPYLLTSGWWVSLKNCVFSVLSQCGPDFPFTDNIASLFLHARWGQVALRYCQACYLTQHFLSLPEFFLTSLQAHFLHSTTERLIWKVTQRQSDHDDTLHFCCLQGTWPNNNNNVK